MKKVYLLLMGFIFLLVIQNDSFAQCSVCTKTAQQMGEGPAKALNTGILYLMITPFAAIGFIIYRWVKYNNREESK